MDDKSLLIYTVATATLYVMELTLSQAAEQTGLSVRSLQRGIQNNILQPSRQVGNHLLVDDIALTMWARSHGRGRRWNASTVEAAMELLDRGETTHATGAVLSRLKGRLRETTVPQLSYLLGGIAGSWSRYRSSHPHLKDHLRLIGPSNVDTQQLGIVEAGGWMTFAEIEALTDLELDLGLIRDPSGNVGVVKRPETESQTRTLLDTYLLGDARESLLACQALEATLPR